MYLLYYDSDMLSNYLVAADESTPDHTEVKTLKKVRFKSEDRMEPSAQQLNVVCLQSMINCLIHQMRGSSCQPATITGLYV